MSQLQGATSLTDMQETTACSLQETYLTSKDSHRLKVKQCTKKAENKQEFVDKVEFKPKVSRRYHANNGNNPSNGYNDCKYMFTGYPIS